MLRDGSSEVVGTPDTAAILVLYHGEQEVLRVPLALDPGRVTVVGP